MRRFLAALLLFLAFPIQAAETNNSHSANLERDSSNYFSIADASQTGLDLTGDYLICAKLNPESLATNTLSWVVGKDQGQPNRSYAVGLRNVGGTTYFEWLLSTDGTNTNTNNYRIATTTPTGVYHLYCWRYTSATGAIQAYIDGSSAGTGTGSSGIFNSTAEFAVGRAEAASYFDGLIDSLYVYSDDDTTPIAGLVSDPCNPSETNLVSWFRFNNDATDSVGSNNLTNNNSTPFTTSVSYTCVAAVEGEDGVTQIFN